VKVSTSLRLNGNQSVLQAPTHLPKAIVQVPKLDTDGNPLGGVRLPGIEVPLGTHGTPNTPASDFSCSIGDKRLSLKKRYYSQEQYLERVRCVVNKLVKEGFLLEEDMLIILSAAEQESRLIDLKV